MKVAILGAGFGLYGYLPALASIGHTAVLPQRYRRTVEDRKELVGLLDKIEWQVDDDAVLDHADALVFARRPDDQTQRIADVLGRARLQRLVLEKPLARTPAEAARLHAQLAASGRVFRVGYTFPLTAWGQRLLAGDPSAVDEETSITWRFRAHHYAANVLNWKRLHSSGGGALRFYGIQIICLLARMGYDTVTTSTTASVAPDEVETWRAVFGGRGRAPCRVTVETNVDRRDFAIETQSPARSVSLEDPFGEQRGLQDRRVPILAELCRDVLESDRRSCDWYEDTIALWQQVEQVTTHRGI